MQAGLPYGLPMGARKVCVTIFSGLDCVKLQCKSLEHPSASDMTIRLAIELASKPYNLSTSSNASRITKRLADGCSKGPRCVFSALDYVKSQRGPSKHSSAIRMVMCFALELAGKSYDLAASSNASRITKRLADGCSKEHSSVSRMVMWLAIEFVRKPYDLSASSNANRITKRLADGCSKGPRCVFSALNCVKLQRESFEHPSASRVTIWLALKLVGKPYDLPVSSNTNRLTIRLADGCSKDLRYVFSAFDYVKSQHGPSKHSLASHMIMWLTLKLAGKSYDLLVNLNARRITKRLADGCSEGPRCVFTALHCVKLRRGSFEYPSASRITIRLALELVSKSYDLLESFMQAGLPYGLPMGARKVRVAVFSGLDCVKLQCKTSEHPSASCMVMRLAIELVDKPYGLLANSNASRITKRFVDGCSKDFVAKSYDLLASSNASRITIRLTLKLVDKPYDLPARFNASRLTIQLVDGCSEGRVVIFSGLDRVKLQCKPSEHPSVSRMVMRFAIELVGKPYDLSASFNASRITKRLADGCSEVPRCVFSALNYLKLQREHSSFHRQAVW
ncbi:hypothetical protein L7F22_059823 [Adiantum nelumboides]|nr:hypothetical protein [Adiantum nelumboides]